MSSLRQRADARLSSIADLYEAMAHQGQRTGRAYFDYNDYEREFVGRSKGYKDLDPAMVSFSESPSRLAKAIRSGKGKLYKQIRRAVTDRERRDSAERRGRRVEPHRAMSRKCQSCGVPHKKGQHRSHGRGSFERTHPGNIDFEFNPRGWTVVSREGRLLAGPFKSGAEANDVMLRLRSAGVVSFLSKEGQIFDDRLVESDLFQGRGGKQRTLFESTAGLCYLCGKTKSNIQDYRGTPVCSDCLKQRPRKNPKRDPRKAVQIYKTVREIVAKRGPNHRCSAACVRANHTYRHKFETPVEVLGMPDGTIRLRPRGR